MILWPRSTLPGLRFVYCGYIGGADDERGHGIAVDGSGCAYITGEVSSTEAENFPVINGLYSDLIMVTMMLLLPRSFLQVRRSPTAAISGASVYDRTVGFGIAVDSSG